MLKQIFLNYGPDAFQSFIVTLIRRYGPDVDHVNQVHQCGTRWLDEPLLMLILAIILIRRTSFLVTTYAPMPHLSLLSAHS